VSETKEGIYKQLVEDGYDVLRDAYNAARRRLRVMLEEQGRLLEQNERLVTVLERTLNLCSCEGTGEYVEPCIFCSDPTECISPKVVPCRRDECMAARLLLAELGKVH
jgi:hypothetical protein